MRIGRGIIAGIWDLFLAIAGARTWWRSRPSRGRLSEHQMSVGAATWALCGDRARRAMPVKSLCVSKWQISARTAPPSCQPSSPSKGWRHEPPPLDDAERRVLRDEFLMDTPVQMIADRLGRSLGAVKRCGVGAGPALALSPAPVASIPGFAARGDRGCAPRAGDGAVIPTGGSGMTDRAVCTEVREVETCRDAKASIDQWRAAVCKLMDSEGLSFLDAVARLYRERM